LSTVYKNKHNELEWECGLGHRWSVSPDGVQQGTWCPRCAGKLQTIQDYRDIAAERGGTCLSSEFKGIFTKLEFQCAQGHVFSIRPNNAKNMQQWCARCAHGDPTTIELFHCIATDRGGACLSTSCNKLSDMLSFRCAQGHGFEAKAGAVKGGGTWCPQCAGGRGEALLAQVVEEMGGKRFKKARPQWLVGKSGRLLELDLFDRKAAIAIEYQGRQHYQFIDRFHGTREKFEAQQERDRLKAQLCAERGVLLLVVPGLDMPTLGGVAEALTKALEANALNLDLGRGRKIRREVHRL
jgi:hypothetical protein